MHRGRCSIADPARNGLRLRPGLPVLAAGRPQRHPCPSAAGLPRSPFMRFHQVAPFALAALSSLPLQAAAGADSAWQFSGFATAGAVYTHSDELQFARVGIDAPGGNKVDTGPDSVLGVQAGLQFGERNTAVVQLVTRETQRGDYDPRAALAFVSHALTPELT